MFNLSRRIKEDVGRRETLTDVEKRLRWLQSVQGLFSVPYLVSDVVESADSRVTDKKRSKAKKLRLKGWIVEERGKMFGNLGQVFLEDLLQESASIEPKTQK